MELLDLRDELRDIWLWLGDDDWLLARSHVAPVPLTLFPIAAEAATDVIADVEQEAAPAPLIVPAWVTITNGWTDAPMLPVNPINFFQFLLPKDPNYWQLLLSFIATPHIQEIFHFRNVSNQIMKKGREEEWTDGGRRERKKERSWNGRWKEIALELLLSGCAFCWRGILFFLRLVFIGNFFFETQKRRRRRKKKKKREKCNWFSNDRLVERRSLRAGDRSLQTPKAESEATPSATTTIFFFFWGGFGFDGNGGEKKMRKKLYNSITDTLIRGGTCGFATIIWFSSSSFFYRSVFGWTRPIRCANGRRCFRRGCPVVRWVRETVRPIPEEADFVPRGLSWCAVRDWSSLWRRPLRLLQKPPNCWPSRWHCAP